MSDYNLQLGAGVDWKSFLDQVYRNVNQRYAAETELEEEAKELKKIDRERALRCITDTVCIMT